MCFSHGSGISKPQVLRSHNSEGMNQKRHSNLTLKIMETPIFWMIKNSLTFENNNNISTFGEIPNFFLLNVSTWGRTSFQWEKVNDMFLPFKLNNNFQPTNHPTQPNPTQPNPTQPNPTQPNPTQPNPTQPTNQPIPSINEVPI